MRKVHQQHQHHPPASVSSLLYVHFFLSRLSFANRAFHADAGAWAEGQEGNGEHGALHKETACWRFKAQEEAEEEGGEAQSLLVRLLTCVSSLLTRFRRRVARRVGCWTYGRTAGECSGSFIVHALIRLTRLRMSKEK